jgi:16S rRNA (guanine527-N7)-methyltransferase
VETAGLPDRIAARGRLAGVSVPARLAGELARYLKLLFRWNERMNLTGLTDDDAGIDRLLVEPLVATGWLSVGPLRLVDIGSGGGSPAVPMRLVRPDVRLQMVESKGRKAAFLREAVRHLALTGARVESRRYEELAAGLGEGDRADVVTVRAVRVDEVGFRALAALLAEDGRLFLFEGQGTGREDGAAAGFEVEGTFPLVESLQSRLSIWRKGKYKAK